jgi:hypothetical protein
VKVQANTKLPLSSNAIIINLSSTFFLFVNSMMLNLWKFSNYKNNDTIEEDRGTAANVMSHNVSSSNSSSSSSHSNITQVSPLIHDQKNHDHRNHHHHQDENMCCIICLENCCSSGILCDRPQLKPIKTMTNSSGTTTGRNSSNNSTGITSWGWNFSSLTNDNHRSSSSKNKNKKTKTQSMQAHFICTECFSSYVKSLIVDMGSNLTLIVHSKCCCLL